MMEKIKEKYSKRNLMMMGVLIVVALLSIFVFSNIATSPSINAGTIQSLDDKKVVVMSLAAVTAASSTALTLIPGDVAMPIANQIAELSTYFIVILCAILLEKTLITAVGYVSFTFIIPFACALGISYLFVNKGVLKVFAIKLAILGIVLSAAIPISVHVSDIIYSTYQESIEQTVETVELNNEYIDETKKDLSANDKNWIENIGDYLSNITSKIGIGISAITEKAENTLSTLLDTIAVLIITSCVIPIVILMIFAWIIKILFGFNINGTKPNDYQRIAQKLRKKGNSSGVSNEIQ